jgi:hypothetical protein
VYVVVICINDPGLPLQIERSRQALCFSFLPLYRGANSAGAPADLPPMQVQLKPGAKPRRSPSKGWFVSAAGFLSSTTRNLERIDA